MCTRVCVYECVSVMKVFAHHPTHIQNMQTHTHTLSTLFTSPSHATDSSPSFETPSPGALELWLINLFFPQPFYSLLSLFLCYGESQYQSIKSSLGSEGLRSQARVRQRKGWAVWWYTPRNSWSDFAIPVILSVYQYEHQYILYIYISIYIKYANNIL